MLLTITPGETYGNYTVESPGGRADLPAKQSQLNEAQCEGIEEGAWFSGIILR